ncbi:MAG TPA: hypothetical protein PKC10_04940 [Cyclobacteriaceae bacterium]|nr:hypothetical protein [Cyclobacteriaceae bacterium]
MKAFVIPLNFRHAHRLIRKSRVPRSIEIPVFLIRCELKNRMFYKHLNDVGLNGCDLESFLDDLILITLRMWDATDVTGDFYFDMIEKGSSTLTVNDAEITKRALNIYHALVKYRDRKRIGLDVEPIAPTSNRKPSTKSPRSKKALA